MGHLLASIALGPLLLLQGRYVRHVTPRLPEPAGAREGDAGCGPRLRLLILGDSAAAGVGAATQSEALSGQLLGRISPHYRLAWKLWAWTGANTADTIKYLGKAQPEAFDVVVISLGVNDLTAGQGQRAWLAQQAQLIELLQARFDARLLLLASLPPMQLFPGLPQPLRWYLGQQARRFNRGLQGLLQSHASCQLVAVDLTRNPGFLLREGMAEDGFHPGPAFYAAWAEQVAEHLLAGWSAAIAP